VPFDWCSSSLAGSLQRLLWSSKWMLAALPHNRWCTNQWMFLYQSVYLDQNLYPAGYPRQIYQDWKIQHSEGLHMNTHIWPADWRVGIIVLRNFYRLGCVACRAAVASAVCVGCVEVHLFLCVPSLSEDSLQCHLARNALGHVVLTKHSLVSFYRNLHLFMPGKLNTPLLLFSDLGMRFLDQLLRFLCGGVRIPSFGNFGHIQGQAHVGLFQLYPTYLPCHSTRHIENVHQIGCCF